MDLGSLTVRSSRWSLLLRTLAMALRQMRTVGDDSLEIARGATAHEAAGAIHTDMHRGFIRAEVIAFDDLVSAGGWERAKGKGLVRVEGKEYVVHEGDILRIRFAV